ncbi:MAG TPA: glycine zipper family protein [Steroidobacteraceae bacterium]|nr:glycine zipper family protein [Steroidobacteraceae bacterium]
MVTTLALLASCGSYAQQPAASAQAPAPAHAASAQPAAPAAAPSGSLSSSLGLYAFPAKNQTAQQQANDETYCFGWAKTQTNIDPMNIKPQAPDQQTAAAQADSATQGARAGGAARGAAGGAVIGAIAGDAGTGAAAGAAAGAMAGGAARRQARRDAQAQAQQQADASVAQQKATYNKAFSACMEGKGYTIK